MKKIIVILLLSFIPLTSNAAVSCAGKVTNVLDWQGTSRCTVAGPDGALGHHLAYKLSGAGSNWICSSTDTSDALIMLAYANDRNVTSRIFGSACTNAGIPHYTKHQYMILNP